MPGLSIRRLITPTRSKAKNDDDLDWACAGIDDDTRFTRQVSQKKQRSKSWMPTTKKEHSPSRSLDIRRVYSNIRDSTSSHQLCIDQPSASAYSLIPSHEAQRHSFAVTASSDTKAASTLCLPEQGQSHRHSLAPPRPSRPSAEHLCPPNLDTPLTQSHSRPSLSLSIPSIDQSDRRSLRSLVPSSKPSPTGSMSTVGHLILKTDEAFKAVGIALDDNEPTSQPVALSRSPSPLPQSPTRIIPDPTPLPLKTRKDKKLKHGMSPSPIASPARNASVKKPKRKKSTKKPFRGPRSKKAQIRSPRSWNLPDNVTDILTGQRFKRIEADEMLTPERLEMLKKKREQAQIEEENRAKAKQLSDAISIHSIRSDNPESPIEPFHLDDLPLRIGASGVDTGSFLNEPSPCTSTEEDVTHQDFSLERDEMSDELYLKPLTYQPKNENETLAEVTPTRPLTPTNRPAHLDLTPSRKPLPLVPEITVTTPDKKSRRILKRPKERKPILRPEEKDGILYLYSTPFTLTNPMFRHGSITFSKSEVCQGVKVMEDTLDWTAFQMAILCGAGDLFPDLTVEEDAKQVNDISDWFESFGFEGHGELVPEDVPSLSSRVSSSSTVSSSPSTVDLDAELPIPVGSEPASGFWGVVSPVTSVETGYHQRSESWNIISPVTVVETGPGFASDFWNAFPSNAGVQAGTVHGSGFWNGFPPANSSGTAKFYSSPNVERWVGDGQPGHSKVRNSVDSLPPSPMLPLFVQPGELAPAASMEPVPMGYNLHHDLGDFLRWETENVCATGY